MRLRGAGLFLLLLGPGCSGSHVADAPASVPTDATLPTLTAPQVGDICDWGNAKLGGYGASIVCDGGGVRRSDSSRDACMAGFAKLAARCPSITAGHLEDCENAALADPCAATVTPGCEDLDACQGQSSSATNDAGAG
jgi:hypothetical protein